MEDDSSNDLIAMDSTSSIADSPIIQFFKRLIVNNSSQNTMLTNAQIQDILTKEFNIDLSKLHELEIDIYINVLKKYLKDWPIWDDFDSSAKELTSRGDNKSLSKLLEDRYENLKSFLQTNLDMAKPLAMECAAKVRNKQEEILKQTVGTESDNMVLEIQATREQLNTLIVRQPDIEFQNTIFKYSEQSVPKHITLNMLSMDAILNWWSVAVSINLQLTPSGSTVFLKRETIHKLEHTLVNRRIKKPPSLTCSLSTLTKIKAPKNFIRVSTRQMNDCLDLLVSITSNDTGSEEIKTILECFKTDLSFLPFCLAQAQYRRYYCYYPYIRYLYAQPDKPLLKQSEYDIQLKESLSPMLQITIGKLDGNIDTVLPPNWLKVDCTTCNKSFFGEDMIAELKQHFEQYHQSEPDWQCSNCQKTFKMAYIASKYWTHDCQCI